MPKQSCKVTLHNDSTRIFHTLVAQISNLLYRRASSLRRLDSSKAIVLSTLCRLEIGDTAGWKPALRRLAIAPVKTKGELSG
jgi:hypothetical protein